MHRSTYKRLYNDYYTENSSRHFVIWYKNSKIYYFQNLILSSSLNEYPKIKEQADIYWGDKMGLRSTHVFGRSYGIKNNAPVVNKTTKRFGCNIISTITNKGLMRFMIFKSRFNADVF